MENDDDVQLGEFDGSVREASSSPSDVEADREDLEDPKSGPGTSFEVQDELQDQFTNQPLATPLAADGLPDMGVDRHDDGVAPPFTYDTCVCIEDDRKWAELWDDEGDSTWRKLHPLYQQFDVRSRYDVKGDPRVRRVFEKATVVFKFGVAHVLVNGAAVFVRPVRPVCDFYRVQVFATPRTKPGTFGHRDVHPNCTARRSIGGAYLSLKDEAVYACQHRFPRDEASDRLYQLGATKRLAAMPHRTLVPAFGSDGETTVLTEEQDPWTTNRIWR